MWIQDPQNPDHGVGGKSLPSSHPLDDYAALAQALNELNQRNQSGSTSQGAYLPHETGEAYARQLEALNGTKSSRDTMVPEWLGKTPPDSFQKKLEVYTQTIRSVPDFFERRVEARRLRHLGFPELVYRGKGPFLAECPYNVQYYVILDHLYYYRRPNGSIVGPSKHFSKKLWELCHSNKLSTIRQWFHTANGVVLSYLLIEDSPDNLLVDKLTHNVLENCANNYSHFLKVYKTWKKTVRKWWAEGQRGIIPSSRELGCIPTILSPYIVRDQGTMQARYQRVLTITQTRNVGLADTTMASESLAKFLKTIQEPPVEIKLNDELLYKTVGFALNTRGATAKVSCGPTACLESTRQSGGQTGLLTYLCNTQVLEYRYNFETLEPRPIYRRFQEKVRFRLRYRLIAGKFYSIWTELNCQGPIPWHLAGEYRRDFNRYALTNWTLDEILQFTLYGGNPIPMSCWTKVVEYDYNYTEIRDSVPVRNAEDLLCWAVQTALHKPVHTRCVRAHVVREPGKARVITVASYAYMVIMYVFGHLWQKIIRTKNLRSGLVGSRHLWSLLTEDLHPQNPVWGELCTPGSRVFAFCSDLEEATDFGNPSVARQIWQAMIIKSSSIPGFPLALAVLAKTLYCGNRYVSTGFDLVVKQRGWFMGDPMTKVLLSLAQDYVRREVDPILSSQVGDDIVALDKSRTKLGTYAPRLIAMGFKVSELDTYITDRCMFFCEEAALVPQTISDSGIVRMKQGRPLDYVDYVRIRLLLNIQTELDRQSYTTLGRFDLLGKETRWVCATNQVELVPAFKRAQLYQHLLVPQQADTVCPFFPQEIGGDGAYYPDPNFILGYLKIHARSPEGQWQGVKELAYRCKQLFENQFGYKLVRSERTNQVVHKYHMWVPYTEPLLRILPPEAIIKPDDDYQMAALASLKSREFETPAKAITTIAKSYYFRTIFSGGKIPETLKFQIGQLSAGQSNHIQWLFDNLQDFMSHWRNPGFKFRDKEKFFVKKDYLDSHNYMNLQWVFSSGFNQERTPFREEWEKWVKESLTLEEQYLPLLTEVLLNPSPDAFQRLPVVVQERLPQYMESDSFILHTVDRLHVDDRDIILVSKDRKLAAQVVRLARRYNTRSVVWLLDPMVYELGRLWEETVDVSKIRYNPGIGVRSFPGLDGALVIQDPGSVLWNLCNSGITDSAGVSTDLGVEYFLRPIIAEETRFTHVFDVGLDWKASINTSSLGW